MDQFLYRTVKESIISSSTFQYTIDYLNNQQTNNINSKWFPSNCPKMLSSDPVKQGFEFIFSNIKSSSTTVINNINALVLETTNKNSSPTTTTTTTTNTNSDSSNSTSTSQLEYLYNTLVCLDLLSSLNSLYKTLLASTKPIIKYTLELNSINAICLQIEELIILKNQINTGVSLTWLLLKDGFVSKEFGLKIIEIVLNHHYNNNNNSNKDNNSSSSSSSPPAPTWYSKTFEKQETKQKEKEESSTHHQHVVFNLAKNFVTKPWQDFIIQQHPVTSANILRLAYQIGFGTPQQQQQRRGNDDSHSHDNDENETWNKVEFIENYLLKILENKSYLHQMFPSSSSQDTFLYTMSSCISLYLRAKEVFQSILVQCVEERLSSSTSSNNNIQNNSHQQESSDSEATDANATPLELSLRILTFEKLQLLASAKIRNKVCNMVTVLKDLQNTDGSWPAGFNSITLSQEETDFHEVKNHVLINTIFAIKAIHAFYERRKTSLFGLIKSSVGLPQHIIT